MRRREPWPWEAETPVDRSGLRLDLAGVLALPEWAARTPGSVREGETPNARHAIESMAHRIASTSTVPMAEARKRALKHALRYDNRNR